MNDYLNRIDSDTPGPRDDVTPLFADFAAFSALLDDLAALVADVPFDVVAAIDALGFILGTGLALRCGVGLVTIRKGGKLPVDADRVTFTDYSNQAKQLEIRHDMIRHGTRVLLVDEWIETGAPSQAAAALIERQGAQVAALVAIHADVNEHTRPLFARYRCLVLRREE